MLIRSLRIDQETMGLPMEQKDSVVPKLWLGHVLLIAAWCRVYGASRSRHYSAIGLWMRTMLRIDLALSRRSKDSLALVHRLSCICIFLCIITCLGRSG